MGSASRLAGVGRGPFSSPSFHSATAAAPLWGRDVSHHGLGSKRLLQHKKAKVWSDEAATPGGVAYGPTLRPPTLAPFYFGVQGQGSQQGRVGSVLAQGHLPGWMHRTKEVSAKGMQWCGSFKGRSGSMGICSDTRHWGGCTPGRSMFGEPGVLHKPHGAPWPAGRRWTPSQRPGSRWPHLATGVLGAQARAQVVLYILEYVLTYAPQPNSHGSTGLVSVSPLRLESSLGPAPG